MIIKMEFIDNLSTLSHILSRGGGNGSGDLATLNLHRLHILS